MIFVSIACYDDLDVIATCKDLLHKAVYSTHLRIVVILQTDRPEAFDELTKLPVEVVQFPASWATGVGWPRAYAIEMIEDEEWYLQLDCHMRMQPCWDELLHEEMAACPPKSVLSAWPPGFIIKTGELLSMEPMMPKISMFLDGVPATTASPIPDGSPTKIAQPAAGVIFCTTEAINVAPPDPHYNYHGEELSLALRWWTNGYTCYAIRPLIVHHAWRDGNPRADSLDIMRHWRSLQRIDGLLGRQPIESLSPKAVIDLKTYSLGNERTVESWETEFGISLANRTVA